jgi:hypothetical protein
LTFWIILILVVAVLLMVGIERLIARFDIRPAHPEETRTGATQVAERVERWAERRTRQTASRRAMADDQNKTSDDSDVQ